MVSVKYGILPVYKSEGKKDKKIVGYVVSKCEFFEGKYQQGNAVYPYSIIDDKIIDDRYIQDIDYEYFHSPELFSDISDAKKECGKKNAALMWHGHRVDIERLEELEGQLAEKLKDLKNKLIKYAVEPVYTYNDVTGDKIKLLYGYIVSKCYVVDENTVLFPYTLTDKGISFESRCAKDAEIGYNTEFVTDVFETLEEAWDMRSVMNEALSIHPNDAKGKRLNYLENCVRGLTSDLQVNQDPLVKYLV